MNSQMITLEQESYWDHVNSNDCLVVFHKTKCPNCKVLLKVMEKCQLSQPEIQMACINSEENELIAKDLEISRVPSILVYKNGEVKARKAGLVKPAELTTLFFNA